MLNENDDPRDIHIDPAPANGTPDAPESGVTPETPESVTIPDDPPDTPPEAETEPTVPAPVEISDPVGGAVGNVRASGYAGDAAPAAPKRVTVRKILKPAFSLAAAAVFFFAMYVEISAYVASFSPGDVISVMAQLPFGGDYSNGAALQGTDAETSADTLPPAPDTPAVTTDGASATAEPDGTGSDSDPAPAPDDGGVRYPIVARDMSTGVPRGLTCSNQTEYELDLDYFADAEYVQPSLADLIASFPPDTENPVVLIIHTHGTESYAPEGADSYSASDNGRSTDITKNVVAVGEVMAQYFEAHGIKTIHCTEMFDEESYMAAYENSSAAVREYLAIYPSIRYIFDVHRDSVIDDDLTKYKAVTNVDGVPTAQFMCVVGTNFKGAAHPHWRDNLTLAAHLQVRLWNRSNTLPRRLSIRGASFYQQYAPGSLLLEIGSCGNTLSEAKACAELVAEELTEIIINGE